MQIEERKRLQKGRLEASEDSSNGYYALHTSSANKHRVKPALTYNVVSDAFAVLTKLASKTT